jgi:molybdopterin/thiamine biosynthesis adenylyltransferase
MLLRLDPLVGEVVIDMPGEQDLEWAAELARRVPFELVDVNVLPEYCVGVGEVDEAALLVDGAGWLAGVRATVEAKDDGNPVGPLAAAALGAAEVFKLAFSEVHPEPLTAPEFHEWSGVFSLSSYAFDLANPAMGPVNLDTTLVGLGGVGAGVLRVIVALGSRVTGSLALVDADVLTLHNLNRVSYSSIQAAEAGTYKVNEAIRFLQMHCPNLTVTGFRETYGVFKSRTPLRKDRRYDVVVTGLDNDEARWEVQRDMPRILIDGATGGHMNSRIERVEFGRYGCLGCTRQMTRVPEEDCDAPPDSRAPSLSFLSSFPGILAAGEMIKEAQGTRQLRGSFDHVFRYGPNPDLRGMPGSRIDRTVGCSRSAKIDQYRLKYPTEQFG